MRPALATVTTVAVAAAMLLPQAATSRRIDKPGTAVELETELGAVTIVIHQKAAPASSAAFLAQVRGQRYDGGSFFRTVRPDTDKTQPTIQVIQAGVRDDGEPVAEAPIPHEDTGRTGLKHIDGAVSLPRAAIGTTSATSFFVSIGSQPALDYGGMRNPDGQGFAVFGQVICGMDVVRRIQARPTSADSPSPVMQDQILAQPVRIVRARITRPRCSAAR